MTLLCIDDDPEDIELFQDAVRVINQSYECVVASNGHEGLKKLATLVPDYIFLDINMPIMDGKETLRNIRKDGRFHSVPICIFSTSVSKKDAELCRVLGADRCMVKPSSFEKLISDLRGVIERR
ncbi:MAG TPA: response regulator [Cyclobacteriaceae bacterium]|nr:response regulator [Cyclobacteriaceae bacterium]